MVLACLYDLIELQDVAFRTENGIICQRVSVAMITGAACKWAVDKNVIIRNVRYIFCNLWLSKVKEKLYNFLLAVLGWIDLIYQFYKFFF